MIKLPFLAKRKTGMLEADPEKRTEKQLRSSQSGFAGGLPEKAQDLMGRSDGERIGFRKPIQG